MLKDGNLYYKADDGNYHKLVRIKNLEETIMKDDDALFANPNDIATVSNLKNSGYFEANIDKLDSAILLEISKGFEEIVRKHTEYCELIWICELAIRYLKEHSRICSDNLKEEGKK